MLARITTPEERGGVPCSLLPHVSSHVGRRRHAARRRIRIVPKSARFARGDSDLVRGGAKHELSYCRPWERLPTKLCFAGRRRTSTRPSISRPVSECKSWKGDHERERIGRTARPREGAGVTAAFASVARNCFERSLRVEGVGWRTAHHAERDGNFGPTGQNQSERHGVSLPSPSHLPTMTGVC